MDFSYRNYETKIGNNKYTEKTYAQEYNLNVTTPIFDPRVMILSAGVGYSVFNNDPATDSKRMTYDVQATFLPGFYVNGTAFAGKVVHRISSEQDIAGYDIISTRYGATLNAMLGNARKGGNNNNNNNNNFGNRSRFSLPRPNISLGYTHTESESESVLSPLHEQRDVTKGSLSYFIGRSLDLRLDGNIEKYENILYNNKYTINSLNFTSKYDVSRDADLRVDSRWAETETENLNGYAADLKSWGSAVVLNFKERNRFTHSYQYNRTEQSGGGADFLGQSAAANFGYRVSGEVNLSGGLNYSTAENTGRDDLGAEVKDEARSINAFGGLQYQKSYDLTEIVPFSFGTGYSFKYGVIRIPSASVGQTGSGAYYSNAASLSLNSSGWSKESMSLSYSFQNKRDDSPLSSDQLQHRAIADFRSKRIDRLDVHARADYLVQEIKNNVLADLFTPVTSNTESDVRSLNYDASLDYSIVSFFGLFAGANRGESRQTGYTLSTLQPANTSKSIQSQYYAGARFNYSFTRNLLYSATARETWTNPDTSADFKTIQVDMGLNYRIRQIFLNGTYQFKQDIRDNNPDKITQQVIFVKLSRPF